MYAVEKKEEEDLGKQRKEECGRNEGGSTVWKVSRVPIR